MMSAGILLAYIVGSVVKWDTLAWCCSAMSICVGIVMFAMPESPVWLRSENRLYEADKSVKWLKLQAVSGPSADDDDDEKASALLNVSTEKECSKVIEKKLRDIIFTRPLMMPLFIGLILLVLQQFSGIDAIIFFTVEIFRESGVFGFIFFCWKSI